MATLEDPIDWPSLVGIIQHYIYNSKSAAIDKTSNKFVYNFIFICITDLALLSDLTILPKWAKIDAMDAIAFIQMNVLQIYDKKHQVIHFQVGQHILLRLHKRYSIPFIKVLGHKLFQKYAKPFRILEKIGNLVYRLKLPEHWYIQLVFIIAQLEPYLDPLKDLFLCPMPELPDSIYVEGDTNCIKSYKIKKILTFKSTNCKDIEFFIQ